MAKKYKHTTARQVGGDDGYCWAVFVHGQERINGLTRPEVTSYRNRFEEEEEQKLAPPPMDDPITHRTIAEEMDRHLEVRMVEGEGESVVRVDFEERETSIWIYSLEDGKKFELDGYISKSLKGKIDRFFAKHFPTLLIDNCLSTSRG